MNWDPVDICRTEYRAAHKEHICSECSGKIQPGEQYTIHHTLFEGRWTDYKQCRDCAMFISDISSDLEFGEGPYFGGLLDDILDSDHLAGKVRMQEIMLRRGSPFKLQERLKRSMEI